MPDHSQRTVLRVDQHGKSIVWERGDYTIAVNSPDDATYITLWHGTKRVGALSLGAGRSTDTKRFATISSVEIDPAHRGAGLGLALYQAALTFASERYLGVGSENEQRANNRQVPRIYQRLGGIQMPSGDFLVRRPPPEPIEAARATRALDAISHASQPCTPSRGPTSH